MKRRVKPSVRPECFWPPALWTAVAAQWLFLFWFNFTFPIRSRSIGLPAFYDFGSSFWLSTPDGQSMAAWWVTLNLFITILLWLAYRGLRPHTRVFSGSLLAASICLAATSLLVIRSMEYRPPLRPAAVLRLGNDGYRCVYDSRKNLLVEQVCDRRGGIGRATNR